MIRRMGLALLLIAGSGCERAARQREKEAQQHAAIEAATTTVPPPPAPAPSETAGMIFGVPVPLGNYYFAKRVAYMFPKPWEEQATPEERERLIWEALLLHFDSFRRGVTISDQELEQGINEVLKSQQQAFTRGGDPAAYASWVKEHVQEEPELFENQMRYLFQIEKFKRQMRESLPVMVTEAEMQQEFLNEKHHVGGEMVTFDTKDAAQALYDEVRQPGAWETMKAKGERQVRPVNLMTLEAYVDLWSVPQAQMDALHEMAIGGIAPPMPFGKQWCVYRLGEKRSGDLANFPAERESYRAQLTAKKQHEALKRRIEELKASAKLQISPTAAKP